MAGETPAGIRPSKCQCFTLALRFTTCPHGLARGPPAFGLARKDTGMCMPHPLAFENGQLKKRWKPFGLIHKGSAAECTRSPGLAADPGESRAQVL